MPSTYLNLSAGPDAADAAFVTKDLALKRFPVQIGKPDLRIAVIGDGVNDLPMLTVPSVVLAGAPQNAQQLVKDTLKTLPFGYIASKCYIDGFLEFYEQCLKRNVDYIFSDRDGVLLWEHDVREFEILATVLARTGVGSCPRIVVITGSSISQNTALLSNRILISRLTEVDAIRENPYILFCENGAVQVNILTGAVREEDFGVEPEMLKLLRTSFRELLLGRIRQYVLPRFGLTLEFENSRKPSVLYLPVKSTMVTINIPVEHDGIRKYRSSSDSEFLREALLEQMAATSQALGIRNKILNYGTTNERATVK